MIRGCLGSQATDSCQSVRDEEDSARNSDRNEGWVGYRRSGSEYCERLAQRGSASSLNLLSSLPSTDQKIRSRTFSRSVKQVGCHGYSVRRWRRVQVLSTDGHQIAMDSCDSHLASWRMRYHPSTSAQYARFTCIPRV